MGLVVAATHLALEQPVAIKFLLADAVRSDVAIGRFLREARVAAMVRSDTVARVYDVGTLDSGIPYIVMEHLTGRDLGAILKDSTLPVDEVCEIALQACEALAEVHACGVVHRDLKPSNLFVTRRADGSPAVKLLDFGISKLTSGAGDSTVDPALTATATVMGSPSYMSPEQLKSTREVDSRTDVWSLGTVLYEALTGKPAFRAETVPQVCAMIASEPPQPPSELNPAIPPELERAVLGALSKDADTRIPLARLARVLARYGPERSRSSLERIEAVCGMSPASRIDDAAARRALPAFDLATAERSRTVAAWGRERRGRSRGGRALLAVLFAAGGASALAWTEGRVIVHRLRGDMAAATRSTESASSGVASAALSEGAGAKGSAPGVPDEASGAGALSRTEGAGSKGSAPSVPDDPSRAEDDPSPAEDDPDAGRPWRPDASRPGQPIATNVRSITPKVAPKPKSKHRKVLHRRHP